MEYAPLMLGILAGSTQASNGCTDGFTLCSPPGATSSVVPGIGSPEFESLYVDLVLSPLPQIERSIPINDSLPLCCVNNLSCLTLLNLGLPFCYDKFTTDYFLPDGSYGTISNGAYNSAGNTVNLITGEYTLLSGNKGNIYSSNSSLKPNTATLPIPVQFTSSGIGTAIPASNLGDEVTRTYTTMVPGSTRPPSTVSPTTILPSVSSQTAILPLASETCISGSQITETSTVNTVSLAIENGTTILGSIIPIATNSSFLVTIMTTEPGTSSGSSLSFGASGTAKKSSAAARKEISLAPWVIAFFCLGLR